MNRYYRWLGRVQDRFIKIIQVNPDENAIYYYFNKEIKQVTKEKNEAYFNDEGKPYIKEWKEISEEEAFLDLI